MAALHPRNRRIVEIVSPPRRIPYRPNDDDIIEEEMRSLQIFGANEPSTLSAICMQQLALRKDVNISRLPKHFIHRIKTLRRMMNFVIIVHEKCVEIKRSWIYVNENGDLDWPATCARCYKEMKPIDFYKFACINGFATLALFARLMENEQDELVEDSDYVIKTTAFLMYHNLSLFTTSMPVIKAAAKRGWPGAVRAWIGIRDELLNNISYKEDPVDPNFTNFDGVRRAKQYASGYAAVVAIQEGQIHVLRYLDVTNVTSSFREVFPPRGYGVPFSFFQQMIHYPKIHCQPYDKLIANKLEYIANALLEWMPSWDTKALQREIAISYDPATEDFLHRILARLNKLVIIESHNNNYCSQQNDQCDATIRARTREELLGNAESPKTEKSRKNCFFPLGSARFLPSKVSQSTQTIKLSRNRNRKRINPHKCNYRGV